MIFAWLRAHIYIRWGWPPLNQNPFFLPYVIGYTDKWENSELNTIYQSLKRYFSIWMHQQQLFNMQIEDLISWYLLRKHIFTTKDHRLIEHFMQIILTTIVASFPIVGLPQISQIYLLEIGILLLTKQCIGRIFSRSFDLLQSFQST